MQSGEVLAVANSPTSGFDRALTGRYPPGSTFKVATSYAYLTRGITTPAAKVPCPASVTVDGREFTNFAGESISGIADLLPGLHGLVQHRVRRASPTSSRDDDLSTAAKALGIGAGWGDTLGVAGTFAGSVPTTTGGTDTAAAAIGQGRVEVSPVALAVMAGQRRAWHVRAPGARQGRRRPAPRPAPLDGTAVAQLRSMMASVVSSGTGTALRGTPGGPVRGKTGIGRARQRPGRAAAGVVHRLPGRRRVRRARRGGQERRHGRGAHRQGLPHRTWPRD